MYILVSIPCLNLSWGGKNFIACKKKLYSTFIGFVTLDVRNGFGKNVKGELILSFEEELPHNISFVVAFSSC